MTRKRFQKLLMADGFSRDESSLYARFAMYIGRPYSEQRKAMSLLIGVRRVCVSLKAANRILDRFARKVSGAERNG